MEQHVFGVEVVMANARRRHLPHEQRRRFPRVGAQQVIVGNEHVG